MFLEMIDDTERKRISFKRKTNHSSMKHLKNKTKNSIIIMLSSSHLKCDYLLILKKMKWIDDVQIFMHKSAMQMQHARDIQRGVSAGSNIGNNGNSGNLAAAINPNNISGLPSIMGASGEIKPHQCQQCLKSFSSNHQLVQHIRVHTGRVAIFQETHRICIGF